MVNISSINNVYKSVGKTLNKTATKGLIYKQLEKARKEPAKYAGKLLVLSFISKDVINTIIYTAQSLNNKKIPEDKRSFVAANDLVLGFFNFGGQLLSAGLAEKYLVPKIIAKKYTGHIKDANEVDQYLYSNAPLAPDVIKNKSMEAIKRRGLKLEDAQVKEICGDAIKKLSGTSQKGKDIAAGVVIVGSALATTALVKRTISPLFSTPIAGWLGNRWDKNKQDKANQAKLDMVASEVLSNNKVQDNDKVEISKVAVK